ncbi:MAG: GIY-YIG nuclease family protein [Chlorobiales bacterium]|nr:GIY-YIG nuclease family protein [Chlorobiales bacterium]
MAELPKTIQIFLPDGNARSIRIADITSRTVQAIQFPRNKLKEVEAREEVNSVGVYFLFGADSTEAMPLAYIGEAENCLERIQQHNRNKDFWDTAIAITSKTASFTKAHGKYLEWYCLKRAKEVERYRLSQTMPSEPHVSEPMKADLMDNFEAIKVLLSTLGYPILESVHKSASKQDMFYFKIKECSAQGEYVDDGFVVFKGAKARIANSQAAGNWLIELRRKLKESRVLVEEKDVFTFSQDYVFNSPSTAASVVYGGQQNGWIAWKNKDGKTLDELKRK